tara:strand:+ start:3807 stop:9857 length:6051 start_codon:yes stop_codon:yes gene_type:complete
MPIKSPHFGLYSFTTGDTYSAQVDQDRFRIIDNSFSFLAEVIGDGIIDGFNIIEDDDNASSITVAPGIALIDKFSTRTFISKRINLPDNRVSYIYVRRRIDTIGQFSGFSDFYTIEFEDTTIPLTPLAFMSNGVSDNSVSLSWSVNDSEFDLSFVEIHRSDDGGDFELTDTVDYSGDLDMSFIDFSVSQNSKYEYIVRAVDLSGNKSSFTSAVAVETLLDLSIPEPPLNIKIYNTDSSAQILWGKVDDAMVSYVQIRYHTMSIDGSRLDEDSIVNVDKDRLNYVFLNLNNSANYRMFIKNVSENGVSSVEVEKILEPRFFNKPEDVSSIFVDTVLWSNATALQIEWNLSEQDVPDGDILSPYYEDPYSEGELPLNAIDTSEDDYILVKVKITQINADGSTIDGALMSAFNDGIMNVVEFNTVPENAETPPDVFPILPSQLYLVSVYRYVNGELSLGRFFYIVTKDFVPPPPVENINISVSSDSSIEVVWNVQTYGAIDLSDVVDYDLITYEYPIIAIDDSGSAINAISIGNKTEVPIADALYLYALDGQILSAELNPFFVAGQDLFDFNNMFIESFQIDYSHMTIGELANAILQVEVAPVINSFMSNYVNIIVNDTSVDRSATDIFEIPVFPSGETIRTQSFKVSPTSGQVPDIDMVLGEPVELYNGSTGGAAFFKLTPDLINVSSKYEFNIRAKDASGNVSLYESNYILVRSEDFFEKPEYPRNLYASPGDGLVILNWSPPVNDSILEYISIYRAEARLGVVAENFIKIDTVDISRYQYVDYTAQNEITYVYLLTTITYYGLESLNPVDDGVIGSALVHMTPRSSNTLSAPFNLIASKDGNDVILGWDFNQDSFDGFEIYRSIDSKVDFEIIDTVPGTIGDYRDVNGLTNTGIYRYMVRKVINEGDIGFTELNELPSFSEFIASVSISNGNITIDRNFGRNLNNLKSPVTEVTREVTESHRHYLIDSEDDRRINFAGGITISNWTTGPNDGRVWRTDADLLSMIDFEVIVSDNPGLSTVSVDEIDEDGNPLHCGGIGKAQAGESMACYRCYRGNAPGFYLFENSDLFCPYWSDDFSFGPGFSYDNRDQNIDGYIGGGYCDHNTLEPGTFAYRQCNRSTHGSAPPNVPIPYTVYIDDEITRMLYDLDIENGVLTFERSLGTIPEEGGPIAFSLLGDFIQPEVKVIFESEEVSGSLPSSLVESVSATQFTQNQLSHDSIPGLQHDGRIKEELLPLRVRMSTVDGYSYYGIEDEDGVIIDSEGDGNIIGLKLWSEDSGPAPIIFYDLMYFPSINILWAASSIGVIYSDDFGVTWDRSNKANLSTMLAPHKIFRSMLYNKVFIITNRSVFVSPVPGEPISGENDDIPSPSGSFSEIPGIAASSAIRDVMEVSTDQISVIGSGLKIKRRHAVEVNLFEFKKSVNIFESNGVVDFTDDLGFQIPINSLTLLELAEKIRETLIFRIGDDSIYMKDLYEVSVDENTASPAHSMIDTDWILDEDEIDFQIETPYLDPRSGIFFSTNLGVYRLRYDSYGVNPILTQRSIFGSSTTNAYAMLNDKEYGRFLISTDAGLIESFDGADTFSLTDDIPDQVPIYSFIQEGDYIIAISAQSIYRRDPGRKDFIEIFYTEDFFMRKAIVHYGKLYVTSSDGLMVNVADQNVFSSSSISLIHASGILSKNGKNFAIHSLMKYSDKLFIGSENSIYISTSSSLIYRHWEAGMKTVPAVYVNDVEQKIGWYILNSNNNYSLTFDDKYDSEDSITVARQYSRFKARNGGWVDQDFASIVLMYINGFRMNEGSRAEKPVYSIQEEVGAGIAITDTISHLEGAEEYLSQMGLMKNLLISNEIDMDGNSTELGYLNFTRQNVRLLNNLIDKFNSQTYFTDPKLADDSPDSDITDKTKTSLPEFKVYLIGEEGVLGDFGDYPEEPMVGNKVTIDPEDREWLTGIGYYGDGESGDDNGPTEQSGACCVNGLCHEVTEEQCTSLGGTYLGDDFDNCMADPCSSTGGDDPPPPGPPPPPPPF